MPHALLSHAPSSVSQARLRVCERGTAAACCKPITTRGSSCFQPLSPTSHRPVHHHERLKATSFGIEFCRQRANRTRASATARPFQTSADEVWEMVGSASKKYADMFPLWIFLSCSLALVRPESLTWVTNQHATFGIGLTLFSMGMSIKVSDFQDILTNQPQLVAFGLLLQYLAAPVVGLLLATYGGLSTGLSIGMAVLASCPAGTASNVLTFMAGGETALSVLMTTCSTLAAVVLLPALSSALVGSQLPVNGAAMLMSTAQVVLLPLALGGVFKAALPAVVARIVKVAPAVAVTSLTLTVASTVARSAPQILASGACLPLALVAFHAVTFLIGFFTSRWFNLPENVCRTMAFQMSVRNGVLGAVLASQHFPDPLAPAAGALSVCIQNLLGSAVAAFWRKYPPMEPMQPARLALA